MTLKSGRAKAGGRSRTLAKGRSRGRGRRVSVGSSVREGARLLRGGENGAPEGWGVLFAAAIGVGEGRRLVSSREVVADRVVEGERGSRSTNSSRSPSDLESEAGLVPVASRSVEQPASARTSLRDGVEEFGELEEARGFVDPREQERTLAIGHECSHGALLGVRVVRSEDLDDELARQRGRLDFIEQSLCRSDTGHRAGMDRDRDVAEPLRKRRALVRGVGIVRWWLRSRHRGDVSASMVARGGSGESPRRPARPWSR